MTVEQFISKPNDLNFKRIAEFVITMSANLKEEDDYFVKEIPASVAYSYYGDFFGLLKQEIDLPESTFFLHLIFNGYTHPIEYKGERKIKILQPTVASKIIDLLEEKGY